MENRKEPAPTTRFFRLDTFYQERVLIIFPRIAGFCSSVIFHDSERLQHPFDAGVEQGGVLERHVVRRVFEPDRTLDRGMQLLEIGGRRATVSRCGSAFASNERPAPARSGTCTSKAASNLPPRSPSPACFDAGNRPYGSKRDLFYEGGGGILVAIAALRGRRRRGLVPTAQGDRLGGRGEAEGEDG